MTVDNEQTGSRLRNYLENCVTTSLKSGNRVKAGETYTELMEVIYKFAK